MSTWRDNLRPASWRGVPFEVESEGAKFGRRGVDHEYPQRDLPYREDLGRLARKFQVVGFVLGDDWQSKRDALIAAVEAKGPGELVHPTYGKITASLDEVDVETSSDAGRLVKFTFAFKESGDLQFPTVEASSSAAVEDSADTLNAANLAAFTARFSTAGAPDFILSDAVAAVAETVRRLRRGLAAAGAGALAEPARLASAINDLEAQSAALVALPSQLAARMVAILSPLLGLAMLEFLSRDAGQVAAGVAITPTEQAGLDNAAALRELEIRSCLASGAKAVAAATFSSYDEAIAARDTFADRLAAEAEAADDASFAALSAVRVALVEDVELRAAELVRLRVLELERATSTIEIAQVLYLDGARESEIEARNLPPHPGFVAGSVIVAND